MLPVSTYILGSMLKRSGITQHSARRTLAITARAMVFQKLADFQMAAFLAQVGWQEPGSVWSEYTEDFDPAAHCVARLPDIKNFLLAIGSIMNERGLWGAVNEFRAGPQASGPGFKFVVRKKSEKERAAENKIRFKLVKQETAASLAQQV